MNSRARLSTVQRYMLGFKQMLRFPPTVQIHIVENDWWLRLNRVKCPQFHCRLRNDLDDDVLKWKLIINFLGVSGIYDQQCSDHSFVSRKYFSYGSRWKITKKTCSVSRLPVHALLGLCHFTVETLFIEPTSLSVYTNVGVLVIINGYQAWRSASQHLFHSKCCTNRAQESWLFAPWTHF